MVINGVTVTVTGDEPMEHEIDGYVRRGLRKHGKLLTAIEITLDGEDCDIHYITIERPFERIRRITGYLVGTTDRWNNAKIAEEHDRVKHGLDYIPVNVCVSCGAEMAEGDHVCTLCRDMTRGRVDRAPGFDSRRDG